MNDITVVGLCGNAGTGKDFIAQHIFRPRGYFQWSFAWPFKHFLVGTCQATYEEVFSTKPPHIRHLLQQEGTEKGRMIYGENIWIETAKAWWNTLYSTAGINKIVVADVRFQNEIKAILNIGGKVLKIESPLRSTSSPSMTTSARLHVSESEMLSLSPELFSGVVNNDGTINDTENQIKQILKW